MLTRRNGEKCITPYPVIGNEYTLLKQKTGASTNSTKSVRKKKNPSCLLGVEMEFEGLIRSLQHFVFWPRQPHLTVLHCQNLVLIAVAKEARPVATHPTKRQQTVPEQNLLSTLNNNARKPYNLGG